MSASAVKWQVYIDEAGDRGMHERSSKFFVTSAVLVREELNDRVKSVELAELRKTLGRKPDHPLHFQKLSHSQRLKAAQEVAGFSIETVANVIVCKHKFKPEDGSNEPLPFVSKPDPMYLYAMRLLLERISWYVRDNGGGPAIVTFAHLARFPIAKLHDYRKALSLSDTSIDWQSFGGHDFKMLGTKEKPMLQVADITASSVFKAVEPDDYGNTERRYLEEINPKLYRRGNAQLTSYGLKVFPVSERGSSGSLAWLDSLPRPQ